MNKKRKKILCLSVILGVILSLLVLFILLGGVEKIRQPIKAPGSYTWEDYQAMDHEEKDALYERFDSAEDFEAWMESVQPKETEPDFHWDEPGKEPDAYTYEEYLALTSEQKEAFYQWFASVTEFESWLHQAQAEAFTTEPPAWNEQGRQPDEYTWAEYQALTPEEKDAFFLWFASKEAFEAWMNSAKPEDTPEEPEWDLSGKSPKDYTWSEYQALSPEKQDAFYLWFGSVQAFEAWMESVKPDETDPVTESWNKPGKQPDEYTWEEYQALTPEEQDLFFLWFDSVDAFEAWLNRTERE